MLNSSHFHLGDYDDMERVGGRKYRRQTHAVIT